MTLVNVEILTHVLPDPEGPWISSDALEPLTMVSSKIPLTVLIQIQYLKLNW